MKKYLFILIAVVLMTGCLTACSSVDTANADSISNLETADSIHIVTTIFPEYDWVKEILGNNPANAKVTMLLNEGIDLHSYQASAEDILNISTCDLFIYVGGESDAWVDGALKESTNENMIVINLLEVLGDSVKEEEMVEGMQAEEHTHEHGDEEPEHDADTEAVEHEYDEDAETMERKLDGDAEAMEHDIDADTEAVEHEHDESTDAVEHDVDVHEEETHEIEYDEHVWLSLKNASVLCNTIADALATIDSANANEYESNLAAYQEKLNALDTKYQDTISNASISTLLFGDRFPFLYLVNDYNLDYYAAFAGCSAETEADFETITFLSQKVDELSLPCVMTIEGTTHKIAETIVENTQTKDQHILSLDSMQSVTSKEVGNGTTYLTIMENNLETLKSALK